ncbi:MAG: hypothetical protein RLZZ397_808 [Pseudomonadota bacterium]|jgi:uncharacterized protein (TIGR00251 family)
MHVLHVYCQPGAKQTQVCGLHDGRIKIQLKAPALEGAANKALIEFLAEQLKAPKTSIRIESGQQGRFKKVVISHDCSQDPETLLMSLAKNTS